MLMAQVRAVPSFVFRSDELCCESTANIELHRFGILTAVEMIAL